MPGKTESKSKSKPKSSKSAEATKAVAVVHRRSIPELEPPVKRAPQPTPAPVVKAVQPVPDTPVTLKMLKTSVVERVVRQKIKGYYVCNCNGDDLQNNWRFERAVFPLLTNALESSIDSFLESFAEKCYDGCVDSHAVTVSVDNARAALDALHLNHDL